MSSLGFLSSAGAHFFQLGFKLRNTSVCLVSARCQHFCSACSGAPGRLMNSVGKTSRNNSISFFPLCLESGDIFGSYSPGGFRAKRSERRQRCSRVHQACLQSACALTTHCPASPFPHCPPPHTQGEGQPYQGSLRSR